MDQMGQLHLAEKSSESIDTNESHIDFYHSLVRFLKYVYKYWYKWICVDKQRVVSRSRYAHEMSVYKNQTVKNRILVFVCKYMFRLNKNLELQSAEALTTANMPKKLESTEIKTDSSKQNEPSLATVSTTSNTAEKIVISGKYQSIVQDLIKQYLIVLDIWSHPFSTEFYNQVHLEVYQIGFIFK